MHDVKNLLTTLRTCAEVSGYNEIFVFNTILTGNDAKGHEKIMFRPMTLSQTYPVFLSCLSGLLWFN